MNKNRRMISIIPILIALSTLVSCTGRSENAAEPQPSKQTTLTMWTFSMNNELPLNDAFMQRNPDIRIETLPVPWADYEKRLFAALTTGEGIPDIVIAESYWWGKWQHTSGIFEDLSAYGISREDVAPQVADAALDRDGRLAIAPLSIGVSSIWYRKDLAIAYLGTDDPAEIERLLPDWLAIEGLGEKVKKESGGKHFLFPETASLAEFLIAANKNYIDGDTLMLTERILPLFRLIEKWRDGGYIANLKGISLDQSYSQGNVLFYPYADWHGANIKERDPNGAGEWGVIRPPGGVFYRGGYGYAIPVKSDPDRKEAAARRIRYTLSPEGARQVMDTNQISVYRGIAESYVPGRQDDYFPGDLRQTFLNWSKQIDQPIVYNEHTDIIEKELRIQAYNMMVSPLTAEQAVEAARRVIEASLDGGLKIK